MALVNRTEPFDYVIFGATGDLTRRKLLPAFLRRFHAGEFGQDVRLICVARSDYTTETFRAYILDQLHKFAPDMTADQELLHSFTGLLHYVQLDVTAPEADWQSLHDALPDPERIRVFYLATAPSLYAQICTALAAQNLISPHARVVLEKPIGTSLATALEVNSGVGRFFPEESIYRIDHYLGKEGVQNILALRFANRCWKSSGRPRPLNMCRSRQPKPWALAGVAAITTRQVPARHGAEPPASGALHGGDGRPGLPPGG